MDNREMMEELLEKVQQQMELFEKWMHAQIEIKDHQIDRLHEELAYYKEEQAEKFLVEIIKELIAIRKSMKKSMKSERWELLTADEMRKEYQYIYEDITDFLERQEVDEYITDSGEDFSGQIHKVSQTELTEDAKKDKKIKKSVMEGYSRRGRILLPEKVTVYQYKGEGNEKGIWN